jgi:hypothetical protein
MRQNFGLNAMKINFKSSIGITSLVGFNSFFQASGKDMQDTGNGLSFTRHEANYDFVWCQCIE